jgi:dolichol kinase
MSVQMSVQGERYERNASRKLWHLVGCILMLVIFYLWKGLNGPFLNPRLILIFVWCEVAIIGGIDIIRFYRPDQNETIKLLPFYGKLMRQIEENHFNATTYYLLAAAILVTAWHFGQCQESTLVLSIAVLGFSDPAAAWTRYQFQKRGLGHEKTFGMLAFLLSSFLVMRLISWRMDTELSGRYLFCIGLIVAIVESYTKYWVGFVRPITRRVQKLVAHRATRWVMSLYPDDNLVIPLAVAALAGILKAFTAWQ